MEDKEITMTTMDEELGMFIKDGEVWVKSTSMANYFGKMHKNVMRDIREKILPHVSEDFAWLNFEPSSYTNEQNKKQPEYLLTRSGFSIVAMGFTGAKAMEFKEAYIRQFELMYNTLEKRLSASKGYKIMTDAISDTREAKSYHFSNEADMINRIVLGMTSKEYREHHNVPDGNPIRDYMPREILEELNNAELFDANMILSGLTYQERKEMLTRRYTKKLAE